MDDLPQEIKEKLLLHAPPDKLRSFCLTSRQYYDICQDPLFWRDKFLLDGLPLWTLQGATPGIYLPIYEKCLALQSRVEELSLELPPGTAIVVGFEDLDKVSLVFSSAIFKEYLGIVQRYNQALSKLEEFYEAVEDIDDPSAEDDFEPVISGISRAGLGDSSSSIYSLSLEKEGQNLFRYRILNRYDQSETKEPSFPLSEKDFRALLFFLFYQKIEVEKGQISEDEVSDLTPWDFTIS